MAVRHRNPEGLYALPEMFTHVVAVTDAELVFLSGQVAWDERGELVGAGDHAAQAAQVARNIEAALAAVGATPDDVVKQTIYVAGYSPDVAPAVFAALNRGRRRPPASTLVPVPALYAPGYLIEVEVVAAVRR
ncbi:MAG: RidA family protein [Actinomycetes bacterium]|jgi:enamine deaminase RidA (YjgF/YER057c/UK114 family)|nr:MAG: RidA family protein [Actinomycetota bacterium]